MKARKGSGVTQLVRPRGGFGYIVAVLILGLLAFMGLFLMQSSSTEYSQAAMSCYATMAHQLAEAVADEAFVALEKDLKTIKKPPLLRQCQTSEPLAPGGAGGSTGSIGAGSVSIASDTALALYKTGNYAFNNTLSGAGSLQKYFSGAQAPRFCGSLVAGRGIAPAASGTPSSRGCARSPPPASEADAPSQPGRELLWLVEKGAGSISFPKTGTI